MSIGNITKALRIPELKYEINNNEETEEVISNICELLIQCAQGGPQLKGESSLIKVIGAQSETYGLSPRIYNSLFLCDRLADVFYRKANIDDQLKNVLSGWRFVLARIFIQYPTLLSSEDSPVLALIDEICASQIGWTPEPKRVSQAVIDRLGVVHEELLTVSSESPDLFDKLRLEWSEAQAKQDLRVAKLVERLVLTEQGAAKSRYASDFSLYTLGRLLKSHKLPVQIGEFISTSWQRVLRNALLKSVSDVDWQALVQLTEKIILVFSHSVSDKKESLYRMAEGVVDELAAEASHYDVVIKNDEWESIQQLLISVLQGAEIERVQAKMEKPALNFDSEYCPTVAEVQKLSGKWYLIKDESSTTRLKFSTYFEDSREILWLNHAGMKSMVMPYESFMSATKQGRIREIPACYLLSQVFTETLKGLGKVAKAQHLARVKAKEKAEAEAERLKLEKQKAEELARLKEAEAAKLIKEQRLKAAEKKRLEQEKLTLKLISEMSLGSWISVFEANENQKYKLVVKINATDKLIFVDKMGLKKFEIKTPELMQRMISGDIELLSGGAEFDDTLSRVVGRLRVGK